MFEFCPRYSDRDHPKARNNVIPKLVNIQVITYNF